MKGPTSIEVMIGAAILFVLAMTLGVAIISEMVYHENHPNKGVIYD